VLVHYFGQESDVVGARSFCNERNALIVEDCTHVLIPQGQLGTLGDFVIYSPHKWLAIPDGALLIARDKILAKTKVPDGDLVNSIKNQIQLFPKDEFSVLNWAIKQFIFAISPMLGGYIAKRKSQRQKTPNHASLEGAHQSKLSKRLLVKEINRLEFYRWKRFENAALLERSYNHQGTLLLSDSGVPSPYLFRERIMDSRESRGRLIDLRNIGVPCLQWPDLPPEVSQNASDHRIARELSDQAIYFPVHPQIQARKLVSQMGAKQIRIRSDSKSYKLITSLTEPEWRGVYDSSEQSHLQQSMAYLKAQAQYRGWSTRFLGVEKDDELICVFGALEKSGPFGSGVSRINRGPIWANDSNHEEFEVPSLACLLNHYKRGKGRLLYIAPNMIMNKNNVLCLSDLQLKRRKTRPWQSICLDISKAETDLMASLNGKWRNQLRTAEKKGLICRISISEKSSEWMRNRHIELMKQRNFQGPSSKFVSNLRDNVMEGKGEYIVLQALLGQHVVAGISIVKHGRSATYLLGWNGDQGRRLNANNFLLWNACLNLKKSSILSFDLGGINEMGNPGITSFKRGMNGAEYRLVGEFRN
jgi:lipid II:glycine glycyltransferase (peptidoglycan interpeptide bridge formation enzyme)